MSDVLTVSTPVQPSRPASRRGRRRYRPGRAASAVLTGSVLLLALAVGSLGALSPLLGVATALLIIGVVLVIRQPDLVVIAVLVVIYSNALVLAVQKASLPVAMAALVPLVLLVPVGRRVLVRRDRIMLPPALGLVLLYGGVQAVSALVNPDPGTSLAEVAVFLSEGLAVYVLVSNAVVGTRLLSQGVTTLLLVGAVLGALSLYQQITHTYGNDYFGFAQVSRASVDTGTASNAATDMRLAGPIGEKNRYAQILAVLIPLAVIRMGTARRVSTRLLSAGCGVLIMAGIVLTYSRGAAVGLAAVALLALLVGWMRWRWLWAVLAAVVAVVVASPAYALRLATLGSVGGATAQAGSANAADNAVRGRVTENLAALLAFRDHPILGVGPGRFRSVYTQYEAEVGIRLRLTERSAHNLFAGIAAELGLVGLGIFIAILVVTLSSLLKARRVWAGVDRERSALATGFFLAVCAYAATGVFLHLSYERYFWLLMAMAAAAARLPGHEPAGMAAVGESTKPRRAAEPVGTSLVTW